MLESIAVGFVVSFAVGGILAGFAGFQVGKITTEYRTEKEHIILVAQNEAYERILNVSTIRREIK